MSIDNAQQLLQRLPGNQQRGSKPRCHFLTHGSREQVASRLTGLINPWGIVVPDDKWMPEGFEMMTEAQLDKDQAACLISEEKHRMALRDWWLVVSNGRTKTPHFDIASTCTIKNKKGLLLIEAKAHDVELRTEEKGKPREARITRG